MFFILLHYVLLLVRDIYFIIWNAVIYNEYRARVIVFNATFNAVRKLIGTETKSIPVTYTYTTVHFPGWEQAL